VPGATQETIDQMSRLSACDNHPQSSCEIGPGSGRYREKIKELAQPAVFTQRVSGPAALHHGALFRRNDTV